MSLLTAYIARRLLIAIPTLIAVSLIVFMMAYLSPSDPVTIMLGEKANPELVQRLKHEYGLDRPAWAQYLDFVRKAGQGTFGLSFRYKGRTVSDIIGPGLPVSGSLALIAVTIMVTVGIPFGIAAALKRDTLIDRLCLFFTVVNISVPNFVMAFLFIYILALKLKWLPVAGWGTPKHYVMPGLILGLRATAFLTRLTRSSMLDVMRQDYIRTARAKGLAAKVVIARHALKNTLIPVVTVIGSAFGALITGSFIIEQIFAVPGIGRYSVQSVLQRDYPVVQATVLLIATVYVITNLVVDIIYTFIDPRIKYS